MKARTALLMLVAVSFLVFVDVSFAPPPEKLDPVAVLTVDPEYVAVDSTVELDGSSSYDEDTLGTNPDITKYEWDFDYNGSTFDVDYWEDEENYSGTLGVATHTYTSEGTYIVGLKVYDNDSPAATDIETCTVYVVDDPNTSNQTTGVSSITSGVSSGSIPCGWTEILSRDGSDDGDPYDIDGQLTIELNTCQIYRYEVESFPQYGGAGGTADLEEGDVIIVWDEDTNPNHGEDETYKNFTFGGEYDRLEESEYSGYLYLTTTDTRTNWGVYLVTEGGTFTKDTEGINEHEVLDLTHDLMNFWKEDDIADGNCVSPGNEITFSICWYNNSGQTIYDANIIDWLPEGVDPNYIISFDPLVLDYNYNIADHSYTWELDDMDPNDSGCVELTVTVNDKAESGYFLYNLAEMYLDDEVVAADDEFTQVCCWDDTDPNIIYVDWTADGDNNGTDWDNAYTDLADAISRVTHSICSGVFKIYVAQGTYDPGYTPDETFELPDNCKVYGGFKAGGSVFSQRNPMRYDTILTGQIGPQTRADTVVTMGDDTLLDGFIVTKSAEYGVYGDGVDFTIENCVIDDNDQYGIYAKDGDVIIKWCKVSENTFHGISHQGENFTLTVENSQIMRNMQHGIYCLNSTLTVKNSIICESGLGEDGHEGIRMINPTYSPVLYNNTLSNNWAEGIYFEDDHDIYNDPNNLDYPDIQNCIVYYNNPGGGQIDGFDPDNIAEYCCIQDCNEVDTLNYNNEPGFAYTVDPNGRPDPKNYHLAHNAFCKDKASPSLTYTGQVDIDGEGIDRKYGTYVDIGADEVYYCDEELTEGNIYSDLDWSADGIINLHEFSIFSAAWLGHDPNDPEWSDPNLVDPNLSEGWYEWKYVCNLDATGDSRYSIDLADFALFCDEWLWAACWKLERINEEMVMFGGGEAMMMTMPLSMDAMSLEMEPEPAVKTQPEISADTLVEIIVLLDEFLAEQTDNAENIEELRAVLIDELKAALEK